MRLVCMTAESLCDDRGATVVEVDDGKTGLLVLSGTLDEIRAAASLMYESVELRAPSSQGTGSE